MNKFKLGKKGYSFIAAAVIVSMVAAVSFSSKINSSASSKKKTTAKERLLDKRNAVNATLNFNKNASENEVVRAIVTLVADSVVETEKGEVTEYNSKLKSQENKIIKGQERIIKQAEKITGKKVENQSAYLVNSFSIDATRKQMRQLAKLKGVEAVYEASKYKMNMNTAVKEGNAVAQWNDEKYGYTGEGIVVAVLDTGVNYKHQDMVLDKNVNTKFTKEQWKQKIKLLGYGEYFTEKVPFGYNYCTGESDCLSKGEYHGYHVSGIIAGNNDKIQGVAKNAQVIGLKVLDDMGGGTTDDIVKGIEDAVKLDADVINMSLGMDCAVVSDEDFMQVALNNANKEGVICCIAAGNAGTSAGDGDGTNYMNMKDTAMVGTPAVAKSCLAVASADNILYKKSLLINATVGKEEVVLNAIDPVGHGFDLSNVKLVNAGVGSKNEKLTVNAKKIKGKIAVATEGKSEFSEKIYCLSKAGAKGIILVSDNEKVSANVEAYDWEGVPVIVVGKNEGKAIIRAAKRKQVFSTKNITDNGEVHTDVAMSSFTSWGPTNELDIKPEITAPGGNIKAAFDGTDKYAVLSGTSMATPFVAGSEAVMLSAIKARGLNIEGEELSDFMKNSLMNTADAIVDKATGQYYSVRQQGSGMVDVYGAVDNDVLVTYNGEAKVELGEITSNKEIELTFTNYGKVDRSYTTNDIKVYTDYTENGEESAKYGLKPVQGAEVVFSNNNIVVPAGKSVTIRGIVNVTNNFEKDSYVEAFIRFSGNNTQDIGLPLLGFYGDFDNEPIIDKSVYDEGESFVSSKIEGTDSQTAIIEMDGFGEMAPLGMELTKEQTGQNVSKRLSKDAMKIIKKSPTANTIYDGKKPNKKKAIPVKIGDTTSMCLISYDGYALYEVKADEDTGCTIDAPQDIYSVVTVYDSKMNIITTNMYDYFFGAAGPFNFSMKDGNKCYIEITSLIGAVGKYDVSFEKVDYSENSDIALMAQEEYEEVEEPQNEKIKLNKKYTVNVSSDAVYGAEFKAKHNGYVTYNMDFDGFFNYTIFKIKGSEEDLFMGMGSSVIEQDTAEGKFTKEIKVEKGVTYVIEISSLESDYFMDDDESSEDEIKGSLIVRRSDGSNYYTLKTWYNGDKVAFSPNEDSIRDVVAPTVTQLRNAKEVTVKVLDSNKKVLRVLGKVNDTRRNPYGNIVGWGMSVNVLYTSLFGDCVSWDGTVYDKTIGEYKTVSEGQYYIQVESKRMINSMPEVITMPLKVDVTEPKVNDYEVKEENGNTVLYIKPSDDLGLASQYYLDISQGEEDSKTISRKYVTTKQDVQGRYVINLGKLQESSCVTLMIEDMAGNTVYETVVGESQDIEDEEYEDNDEEDMEDGITKEPEISVLDSDLFTDVLRSGKSKTIVMADKLTYPCSFKVKVDSDSLLSDTFEVFENNLKDYLEYGDMGDILFFGNKIDRTKINKALDEDEEELGNVSFKYEGNGIFDITLEKETEGILELCVADKYYNMGTQTLYLCENREQYDAIMDSCARDINLNIEDVISKEDINEDGTLTISGSVGLIIDGLKVNGINATIDKDTLEFYVNIPVKLGANKITVESIYKGESNKTYACVYYNDMKVKCNNLPKADKNGVINVNSDKLRLMGTITSYINIGNIVLNGDNVYSALDFKSYTEENPLIKNFDYNVSLQKGMNYVTMVVKDLMGNEETVELKVNYK